ncbi:hypothetical protein IQ07DRAFT_587533 [Pyrenochaeta sp. DS3sAY3a]|nr:hypothetical protein IQ07DRAFT_587533 [Pyrenochaeta sp. DS3sAY3a]
MKLTTPLLITLAALLPATEAFQCAVGQAGSCTLTKGRCAVKCSYWAFVSNCVCPDKHKGEKYTGEHKCISRLQYDGRHKCTDN